MRQLKIIFLSNDILSLINNLILLCNNNTLILTNKTILIFNLLMFCINCNQKSFYQPDPRFRRWFHSLSLRIKTTIIFIVIEQTKHRRSLTINMITVVVHLFCTIFSAQRGCDTTTNFCNEMHILLMIYNLDFPSIEQISY